MQMRRLAVAVAASLMTLSAAEAGLLPDRVAKAAQERVADGMYPTLVIGVVDGDESEVTVFGKLDNGTAPDGDTVYEIGSITKTFTATLLAQKVLAGELSLDTPVAKLLPGFTVPSRGGKEITLGDIATQHSGLPRLPTNMAPKDIANPYADYDAAKLKAFLAGYALPRDPGASYEYSNLGFGLLGFALAQHPTYGDLVATNILNPLGMTLSGQNLTDAMRAHLAPGHNEAGKPAANWDFDALAGCGALRSTANDMLRYLKANMGAGPLAPAMALAHQPRADMDPGTRIGLAWMTTKQGIVWHNGGTGGYRSFIGFTADGRHGVVVLTNIAVAADDLGFATLQSDAPLAAAHKEIALPPAALDEYAGSYKLAENFILTVSRMGDQLYARATGQAAFPIYASASDEFFAKIAAGISISFTRDAKGAVTGLVLHQNGDHAAPRMSAADLPPQLKEIALDAASLQDYAGKYQFAPGHVLEVTLSGTTLSAQLTGQPAVPIFASAKDKFFYKIVDAQLDFERDAGGKVTALALHQNGHDLRAPRVQ